MFVEINYNCVKLLQMMLRSGNNEIFSSDLTSPCKPATFPVPAMITLLIGSNQTAVGCLQHVSATYAYFAMLVKYHVSETL